MGQATGFAAALAVRDIAVSVLFFSVVLCRKFTAAR
jgi:hypothetical protein